jgi:expansin (peptidoglycan-binding protein)
VTGQRLGLALAVASSLVPVQAARAADDAGPDELPRCTPSPRHDGRATFFSFGNGVGSCGIGRQRGDSGVAALSVVDYAASANCGACVQVTGPRGTVVARVVDRCVHCRPGDLDLSGSAFDAIAERSKGRVPVTWTYVPCTTDEPLRYHFRRGSSPLRTAVQVRGQRHGVRALEYLNGEGQFVSARRDAYAYFVHPMGAGPYTFRLTDAHGGTVVERDVPHRVGREVRGTAQFPACEP